MSIFSSAKANAGTKVKVGRQVASADRVAFHEIDHGEWTTLLRRYVDQNGKVDYKSWKASSPDSRQLVRYLAQLSHADLKKQSTRGAKLAFWINAYNAVTVHGILREYPTSSIRNHTAKFFGYNIWHDLLLQVGGQEFSLEQIEHEVLRKMGEPRIHFAIVCASKGCPRLLNTAYVEAELETQLDENTRDFFSRRQNFRFDPAGPKFQFSSILKWFGSDFGSSDAALLRHIASYLPSKSAREAATAGSGGISYLEYDWSLNEQAK
ncbi:MAG: DUF547 domain-containing protein [Planctomycetota bacterium]